MNASNTPSTSKVEKPVSKAKSKIKQKDIREPSAETAQMKPSSSKIKLDTGNKSATVESSTDDVINKDDNVLSKKDLKSESEMSVLDDDLPKSKRKSKGKNAESNSSVKKSKEVKTSRSKKPTQELSKDEETIKKLKSFIVACGVRKVWSREFKDLDTPSKQIQRLRAILSDLGMTGRMSLEQAKSIRAKREFAQELEDVKRFEQSVVGGSDRKSRSTKDAKLSSDGEAEEKDDMSDEDEVPANKRSNARKSIMAFLDDQSDEE